jgi:hypothetical protein
MEIRFKELFIVSVMLFLIILIEACTPRSVPVKERCLHKHIDVNTTATYCGALVACQSKRDETGTLTICRFNADGSNGE